VDTTDSNRGVLDGALLLDTTDRGDLDGALVLDTTDSNKGGVMLERGGVQQVGMLPCLVRRQRPPQKGHCSAVLGHAGQQQQQQQQQQQDHRAAPTLLGPLPCSRARQPPIRAA